MTITYKSAGVDVEAGYQAVRLMKEAVRSTFRPEVLSDIGGFGGLIGLPDRPYTQPILVAGTDGVGTKLKVAIMANSHTTIGIDCVAMCVNDILVQGAEPLFFLDYIGIGRLQPEKVAEIVSGVAAGCRQAGCALIGGETAEMPGMYHEDDYDLVGFAVGVVDRERIIDNSRIQPGDKLVGLASNGLHSNGYSLVRKILFEIAGLSLQDQVSALAGKTLAQELLEPTRIYVKPVLKLLEQFEIRGMAHITGGGFIENLPRMLPQGCAATMLRGSWPVLPIFSYLEDLGGLSEEVLFSTFNMGLGLVCALPASQAESFVAAATAVGEKAYIVGEVTPGQGVNFR